MHVNLILQFLGYGYSYKKGGSVTLRHVSEPIRIDMSVRHRKPNTWQPGDATYFTEL